MKENFGIKLTSILLNFLPLILAITIQPFIKIDNPAGIWLILTFLYGVVLRSFYDAKNARLLKNKKKRRKKK